MTFLLAFLRARKYKVDKAFAVLCKFSAFWHSAETRAILDGQSAEKLRAFYVGGPTKLLQGRDAEGNGLSTLNAGKMNAAFVNYDAQVHMSMLGLAWLLENEDVQLRGLTIVETFQHFSLGAAMGLRGALSGAQQKKLTEIFLDSMPMRIRHIYVIHQPWYFSMIWAVAKLFFKKKITERVELFGAHTDKLFERVPAAALADRGQGPIVWVIDGTTVTARPVKIVALRQDRALVTGVAPGETIVALGGHKLDPAAKVRIASLGE